MASPFATFRKNQKAMMAGLVLVSLFLFTIGDVMTQMGDSPPLKGLLFGGLLMALIGATVGQTFRYAAAGAVVGLGVGLLYPLIVPEEPVVSTKAGNLTDEQLLDMQQRRNLANYFVGEYWNRAREKQYQDSRDERLERWKESNPDKSESEYVDPEYRRSQAPLYFSYNRPLNEDVVFGMLLRSEADKMGIVVGDDTVNSLLAHLAKQAGASLSTDEYAEVRGQLQFKNSRVSEDVLYDVLRDEIKAYLAFQLLRPAALPSQTMSSFLPEHTPNFASPEQYWDLYQRLHIRQELELVSLPVKEFVDQVDAEPTDEELLVLFEQYKDRVPNQLNGGDPGFLQLRELQLALLEIDYEAAEQAVGDVSEERLKEYYEANKDLRFLNRQLPGPGETGSSSSLSTDPLSTTPFLPSPNPTGPSLTNPGSPSTEPQGAPDPKQPDPETGTDPQPEADPKPESDPKPGTEPGSTGTETGQEGTESQPKGTTESSEAAKESGSNPNPDECGDESPAAAQSDEPAGQTADKPADPPETGGTETATQPGSNSAQPPKLNAPQAPANESTGTAKPAETPAPGQDAAPNTTAPATKAADAAAQDSAAQSDQTKDGETADGEAKKDATDGAEETETPKYRPFEDVREMIQDELLQAKTKEYIESEVSRIALRMRQVYAENSQIADGESEPTVDADVIREQLRELADSSPAISYRETELLNAEEFSEEEKALAEATDPNVSSFEKPTVAQDLFGREPAPYVPSVAEDAFGNYYVYWVIESEAAHVPESLEEVRDQVVDAWMQIQARELAENRAEQVKQAVDAAIQDGKTFSDGLTDVTLTGEAPAEDMPATLVDQFVESQPFSWLRNSSAPRNFTEPQRIELGQVRDQAGTPIEMLGADFMEFVFNELDENELGVVSSFDKSAYMVVRPRSRMVVLQGRPSPMGGAPSEGLEMLTAESLDKLRTQFLGEVQQPFFRMMSPLPQVLESLEYRLNAKWMEELERDYEVNWVAAN